MKKLLSNQISPNLLLSDALYLWGRLPFIWRKKQLDFSSELQTENYLLTNSARTALALIIQHMKISKHKTIGIPAFCCSVMATPFLTAGYQIQWLDTDKNGLIDPSEVTKYTNTLGAVLIPHIFGQLAPVSEIVDICKSAEIITIEDCAHHIPPCQRVPGGDLLTDYRIYSFGREKVLSCVSGGALVWNNKSILISPLVKGEAEGVLSRPKTTWTLAHMLQPLIYSLALPWWYQGGKIIPSVAQKLKLLPKAVTPSEKKGVEDFPQSTLPYPLQKLLKRQWRKHTKTFSHRQEIAKSWNEKLSKIYPQSEIIIPPNSLRVILKLPNLSKKDELMQYYKQKGLLLNDWDGVPISPPGLNLEKFGYSLGQCPNAEQYAQSQITFPTSMRVKEKYLKKL